MTLKTPATLVIFLMALLASNSQAGVFQCEDEDGRTIFTDKPCENGKAKSLPTYETILEPFVSGRVTLNQKGFALRHGVVTREKEKQELLLTLTNNQLSDTEKQQAAIGDWSFLELHKAHGLARITLSFKTDATRLNTLRNIKCEFIGLTDDLDKPWTSNHGGEDIIGHVNKLEIIEDQNQRWLAFSTQEFTPDIRWNINLVLRLAQ
ncbi:MAG: DUF4124 domain-containing protein [Pseudomonadales bacterium]|nr:DUF4124 domain-containing protein [Pseudomonadales bacterium]